MSDRPGPPEAGPPPEERERAESRGPAWRRWVPPLLAVPFLGLLAFGLTRDPFVLPSPLPGRPAPSFALETLDGDSLRLDELRGKVVVLNFWASWCPPCIQEHPVLVRASRTWEADRVAVVGVLYQDTPENGRRFVERWGGEWPTAIDPGSQTAIDYGVYGPPETFFIGPDGRVARKRIGPVRWEPLRATVDSLLTAGAPGGITGQEASATGEVP